MQRTLEFRGGIPLQDLVPETEVRQGGRLRITSCSGEAHQCQPGDLFVALAGADEDGHEQVQTALHRGAVAVVAERLLPIDRPLVLVRDTRVTFGQVCHRLAGQPSDRMRVFGVTGTNGKTTTSQLLAGIFRAAGRMVADWNSISRSDGVHALPTAPVAPTAAELADWLARSEAEGCTHAVVEASSQALAQRRLAGMQLDGAIVTNVRRDHLDFHGTVSNYRRAKARIFAQLKSTGFVVLNADDPASHIVSSSLDIPLITFGRRRPADVTASVVERYQGEQTFLLHAGNETVPVRTRMIGDHHVANCLAAAAAGLAMGLPLTTIARGLESLERMPHRLDRIECGQEFGVYVDAADTPDRLSISLRAVRQVTTGRLICVFNGRTDRCHDELPLLGRIVERSADLGVITGGESDRLESLETVHQILDGYERPARAHVIPERCQAIGWALEQARPGDSVLLAGTAPDHWRGLRRTASAGDGEFARRWFRESADRPDTCLLSIVR